MKHPIFAAILVLAAPAGALAEEPQETGQDEEVTSVVVAEQEKVEEEVICRGERETGSRVRTRRVCHTQSEWDEIARLAREQMDRSGSRGHEIEIDLNQNSGGG